MWPTGSSISDASRGDPSALSLSDLIGRSVAVDWFEAVAIVRAIADRLADPASSLVGVPELHQILLRATGAIDATGAGASPEESVHRLGQLLQALLTQADAPVQLRLMVTQATAPTPLFAAPKEYSEALMYFERPDRAGVLRNLYQRAAVAQPTAETIHRPTLDTVAPLPHETEKKKPKPKPAANKGKPPSVWRAAAVLLIVAGAAAGGLWYARRQGVKTPNRAAVNQMAARASSSVGSAVVSGASAITETLGLGRILPASTPAGPPPSPPPADPAKKPAKPATRSMNARAMPGVAFDLAPLRHGVLDGPTAYDVVVSDADTDHSTADALTTYGPGSDGIVPPISIDPQLPRELPPDLDQGQLGRIELVIAQDGSVESVKLLGPPRNVKDALFLSVAKAWLFQPATRNGVPVRYRKTIWIASQ